MLPCPGDVKYLGLILDRRLTWAPHLQMISERAIRSIGVIRVLARVSWGANSFLLLIAYKNVVHSLLEWGSPLFASTSGRVLRMLDRAQHMALRVVLCYMSSTPTSVFLTECIARSAWVTLTGLGALFWFPSGANYWWVTHLGILMIRIWRVRSTLVFIIRIHSDWCLRLSRILSFFIERDTKCFLDWFGMVRKQIPEWLGIALIRSEWISIRYFLQGGEWISLHTGLMISATPFIQRRTLFIFCL